MVPVDDLFGSTRIRGGLDCLTRGWAISTVPQRLSGTYGFQCGQGVGWEEPGTVVALRAARKFVESRGSSRRADIFGSMTNETTVAVDSFKLRCLCLWWIT